MANWCSFKMMVRGEPEKIDGFDMDAVA